MQFPSLTRLALVLAAVVLAAHAVPHCALEECHTVDGVERRRSILKVNNRDLEEGVRNLGFEEEGMSYRRRIKHPTFNFRTSEGPGQGFGKGGIGVAVTERKDMSKA
ncbi:hypothetical protein B0H13DRAFT_1878743 [Mycena leptocephala]|nr:hypothetical protein B0H13DRAFT_1878743 [Mycena leptocephala]